MQRPLRIFLLSFLLLITVQSFAVVPYFLVGVQQYSETQKFARMLFPSSSFGKFRNGYGAELLMYFDINGKDLPFHLHTAAIFFSRHDIQEGTQQVSVQQLLVPVEAEASRSFLLTKRYYFGIKLKAGPQFLSTMRAPAGNFAPQKINQCLFGWGGGLYVGIHYPSWGKSEVPFVTCYGTRIGGNNFVQAELVLPLLFRLK